MPDADQVRRHTDGDHRLSDRVVTHTTQDVAHGEQGTEIRRLYRQPVRIAPTEDEAHAQARVAGPYFYHQIAKPILRVDQKGDRDRLLASGYGFYASDAMNQMLGLTYDDIIGQDMLWVGTSAQIAARTADFLGKEALDEFAIQVLPRGPQGGLTLEQHRRTQELFAAQVMPGFK